MNFKIVRNHTISVYVQIMFGITEEIENGGLPVNFPLPGSDDLAKELEVTLTSVKSAYSLLERDGVIVRPARDEPYRVAAGADRMHRVRRL